MAITQTDSQFDWHDIDWSVPLWWVLAAAAIVTILYAFTGNGSPTGIPPVIIEEWVP